MSDSDSQEIDGYISADVMSEEYGNIPATTTLMDCIFLPGRVPKDLLSRIASDSDSLEKQLLAENPLLSAHQSKPYWSKGANKREYDTVHLHVYSAVCLADDRHLLEGIISAGGMFADLSDLTLRQAIELAKLEVAYDKLPQQYLNLLDTRMFNGMYDYFHINFGNLFKFLNLKNQKANKNNVLTRLMRLSQMLLVLEYEKEGKALPQFESRIRLVEGNYIPLLVPGSVKNKGAIRDDTITDLIVGVHKTFTASLLHEGAISRTRFLNVYPNLTGKHALTDFAKFLDQHKREYVHGKFLRQLVRDYYDNKVRISKQHITRHVNNTISEVIEKKDVLIKEFSLALKEAVGPNGKPDHVFVYLGDTGASAS